MFPYPYAQPGTPSASSSRGGLTYDCPYCRLPFPEFSAVLDHLHRQECHQKYSKGSSADHNPLFDQPYMPHLPSPFMTPEHSTHSQSSASTSTSNPPFNVDDLFIATPTQSSHSGSRGASSAGVPSSPLMPSSATTATSPATPRRPQKYMCHLCGTSLANVGNLNRHIEALHKDNRRYKCEHCPRAFHRRSELKEHVNVVHYLFKMYRCDLCPCKYSRKEHLQRHIKSDHTFPKRKRKR